MAATTGNRGQLAGLGSRIVANLIDIILFTVVAMVLSVPLFFFVAGAGRAGFGLSLIIQLFLGVAFYAYFIVMEAMYGYTVGKKAMSIKVVGENGSRIGFGESAIRNILRIVDTLPTFYIIGIILIAVTDDEQRVGDIAAGTYVVKA